MHLHLLNTLIEKVRVDKSSLFVCFVDFRKAFDSVHHGALWRKFVSIGVSQLALTILQSMYFKVSSLVRLSRHEATEKFPCQKGVRQGCNLSPLLFSLCLSGLKVELKSNDAGIHRNNSDITTLMFVNDVVLLFASANSLRKHLDTLQSFCQVWRMSLNTEKTKIYIFDRSADKHPFLWKGVALERVNAYKCLGIWITTNGHFRKAEQHLSNQVKKALFSLKAAIQNLQFPLVSVSLKLFDVIIIAILCYGCEIWDFSEKSDLEVVEMNFLKYVLHLPLNASNIAVRGEVGQLPLHLLWKERVLKYWHRLCSEDISVLLKQAMVQACQLGETSNNCWVSKMKSVFNMAGFSSLFSSSGCDAEVRKNMMSDQYLQI